MDADADVVPWTRTWRRRRRREEDVVHNDDDDDDGVAAAASTNTGGTWSTSTGPKVTKHSSKGVIEAWGEALIKHGKLWWWGGVNRGTRTGMAATGPALHHSDRY